MPGTTNILNEAQRASYLADDLMTTARPWSWDQFWSTSSAIRRLKQEEASGRFPKVSLFLGPKGSGKTSAGKLRGMIASCERIDQLLEQHRPPLHCGECQGCRQVQGREGSFKGGYIELNAAGAGFADWLQEAVEGTWHRKTWGSDRLPYVVAIDEAGSLSERTCEMLHKLTEETLRTSFVLIMREAEYPKLSEPLKDRTQGGRYRFQLPAVAEAAAGLMSVGQIVGIELLEDAAVWIAQSLSGLPRACLASLNRLRGVDGSIDLKKAQDVLADIASENDDE